MVLDDLGSVREGPALDELRAMDRFLADVERRAFRMADIAIRNPDDALDIVQDTMLRFVRKYADRPRDEWRPLFFRILRNRITDHHRGGSVRRRLFAWISIGGEDEPGHDPVAAAPEKSQPGPEKRAGLDDAMRALENAVGKLPSRQQQAFMLRAVEGLDVAATAAAMGCSDGSVKQHYYRAVHTLRAALGDHWQ